MKKFIEKIRSPKKKGGFLFQKFVFQRRSGSDLTLMVSLLKSICFSSLMVKFRTLAAPRWPFSLPVMAADSQSEIIIYNGGGGGGGRLELPGGMPPPDTPAQTPGF